MAILKQKALFDTADRGFDVCTFDWDRQTVTYTLKIYDTSDVKIAEISGNLQNPTLTQLSFKCLRDGGCADFSFTLAEPYSQATINYNHRVDICLFDQPNPWFSGFIENIPQQGTEKIQEYSGFGYSEKLDKKLINVSKTAKEISLITTEILDSDITPNYPIIKDATKIENTGYTIAGSLQFERTRAKEVFNKLTEIANDYEFGVDEERDFYFRAKDTTINERFWIGKHIGKFVPEKDISEIVNRWFVYSPPFSDGSNYQLMVENQTSQTNNGLSEDFIEAPEIINLYSATNLASGITPTTSPAGTGAVNMTDSNYATLWASGTAQAIGHYIKIDLGSNKNVGKIILDSIHTTAQEYHARGFKIETSTDNITYTQVFATTSDPGWKPDIRFSPVSARYIKITLTEADDSEWKVGEWKIYELDTSDLERWANQLLEDSQDPIEKATLSIPGIDEIIGERATIAPIKPRGKLRVTSEDGLTTFDYEIVSCTYSLSSSGFNLDMELGDTKLEPSDWMKKLRRQLAEYRLLGIRRSGDIASGIGIKQGTILSTMIGEDAIETPHLSANIITAEMYNELRNTYVFNDQDSLDDSFPFETDFEIISEMTAIVSVKLSFRIRNFRAYATGVPSGGGHTTPSGGGSTSGATGTPSGGGSTSGATGAPSGGGSTSGSASHDHAGSTASGGGHTHLLGTYAGTSEGSLGIGQVSGVWRLIAPIAPPPDIYTVITSGDHTHSLNITADGAHTHTTPDHTHPEHTHTTPDHTHPTHTHTTPSHTHTVSDHVHSLTFGIFEDSTSPTIHYHIANDGTNYGAASANYTTDQLDIDITSSISGVGFKKIRFDSTARCRVSSFVLCKIDLSA